MADYVWDIPQEEKELTLGAARIPYSSQKEFANSLGVIPRTIQKQMNSDRNLRVDTAKQLLSLLTAAEPHIVDASPDDFVTRTYEDEDETFVEIDPPFQEFLFNACPKDEFSTSQPSEDDTYVVRGDPPTQLSESAYIQMLEDVQTRLGNLSGPVYNTKSLRGTYVDPILHNADAEYLVSVDIEAIQKVDADFQESVEKNLWHWDRNGKKGIGPLQDHLPAITETIFTNNLSYLKPSRIPDANNKSCGHAFSALERLGLLNQTGGTKSAYEVLGDETEFHVVQNEVARYTDRAPTPARERLITHLQEKARDIGRTPQKDDLRTDTNIPDPRRYEDERHFGSFNNALWEAGLDTNERAQDEDIYLDLLRKYVYRQRFTDEQSAGEIDPSDPSFELPLATDIDRNPDLINAEHYCTRLNADTFDEVLREAGFYPDLEENASEWPIEEESVEPEPQYRKVRPTRQPTSTDAPTRADPALGSISATYIKED